LGDNIKKKVVSRAYIMHGGGRGVFRVFMGKPEGKIPLGRPSCRWEDNIKVHLQEMGCEGMDSIELVQETDRWRTLVSVIMNLQVL
jgi:hypothetical protein